MLILALCLFNFEGLPRRMHHSQKQHVLNNYFLRENFPPYPSFKYAFTLNFSGSPTKAGRDKSLFLCDDSEGSVFGRLISGDQAVGRTRSPAAVKIQVHKTTIRHVNSEQAQPKAIRDRRFYFIITVPENNINSNNLFL